MKTLLYANTIDFDFALQQRPHHLMKLLSNNYKVYWVNQTQVKDKAKDIINNNLEIHYNWDVFVKRVPKVDIYFSSWSSRFIDLDSIRSDLVIYDSLDNFEANSMHETSMISKSNILFTTSKTLYNLRESEHNNIHLCRNGCFPELGLIDYPIPIEYQNIRMNGRPILLFSGALAFWCDLELIGALSVRYNVVVVGLTWGIKDIPSNCIFIGNKSYEELQAYYHHCDVNLLPFKRCQISDYSNPIKMYEGMSHGKITVSTDIPEACDPEYKDIVLTSSTREGYIMNIEKALRLKNDEIIKSKCLEVANNNSWKIRADLISESIEKYYEKVINI